MQLSKKQNNFCLFLPLLLKSASNFKHFEKKMTLMAYVFSKLQTVKYIVRQTFRYPCYRVFFENQHVKAYQNLIKSAWKQFYHVF